MRSKATMTTKTPSENLTSVPPDEELRELCRKKFNSDILITQLGDCIHYPVDGMDNTVCNLKGTATKLKPKKESHIPKGHRYWCPNCIERLYPDLSTRTVPAFNLSIPYGQRVASSTDRKTDRIEC